MRDRFASPVQDTGSPGITAGKLSPTDQLDPPELGRLFRPGTFFEHPRDVLNDATLGLSEKRAILCSWASDSCAVDSRPALRQPPGAPVPVPFDDVMDALRQLDCAVYGERA